MAFENGVQLFFRVLGYYQSETRKYPPSKQFLSSCISILGQVNENSTPRLWKGVVCGCVENCIAGVASLGMWVWLKVDC